VRSLVRAFKVLLGLEAPSSQVTEEELACLLRHKVDFIFIDADHSYEAITKDWQDWFPKVRPGGIIALHECRVAENSPDYLGSMKFYDCDIPNMTSIEQVDSVDSLAVFKVQTSL
jgi:predicted O-methyltransferase YrrM